MTDLGPLIADFLMSPRGTVLAKVGFVVLIVVLLHSAYCPYRFVCERREVHAFFAPRSEAELTQDHYEQLPSWTRGDHAWWIILCLASANLAMPLWQFGMVGHGLNALLLLFAFGPPLATLIIAVLAIRWLIWISFVAVKRSARYLNVAVAAGLKLGFGAFRAIERETRAASFAGFCAIASLGAGAIVLANLSGLLHRDFAVNLVLAGTGWLASSWFLAAVIVLGRVCDDRLPGLANAAIHDGPAAVIGAFAIPFLAARTVLEASAREQLRRWEASRKDAAWARHVRTTTPKTDAHGQAFLRMPEFELDQPPQSPVCGSVPESPASSRPHRPRAESDAVTYLGDLFRPEWDGRAASLELYVKLRYPGTDPAIATLAALMDLKDRLDRPQ